MVVPAFGFSLGDFIAAFSLIHDVSTALKDSGGAAEEYQSLLEELQHLELILQQLQVIRASSTQSQNHYNAICGMARTIEHPLHNFMKKMEKYNRGLGYNSSRGLKAAGRKVQFTLAMRDDIAQLRAAITMKIVTLSLLMTIPTRYVAVRILNRPYGI
jgi:hypothetical protein